MKCKITEYCRKEIVEGNIFILSLLIEAATMLGITGAKIKKMLTRFKIVITA